MADTPTTAAAAQAKPKTAAKRKPATRKPAKRKPATRRKPAARKAATPKSPAQRFATNAQETGHEVFLAGLGFYGKVYDQAQERLDDLQKELKARRKNADKVYKDLVKRGKKVEKDARSAIDDMDIPSFDELTDRKKLEQQLKKAQARFEELKKQVGIKTAA